MPPKPTRYHDSPMETPMSAEMRVATEQDLKDIFRIKGKQKEINKAYNCELATIEEWNQFDAGPCYKFTHSDTDQAILVPLNIFK